MKMNVKFYIRYVLKQRKTLFFRQMKLRRNHLKLSSQLDRDKQNAFFFIFDGDSWMKVNKKHKNMKESSKILDKKKNPQVQQRRRKQRHLTKQRF